MKIVEAVVNKTFATFGFATDGAGDIMLPSRQFVDGGVTLFVGDRVRLRVKESPTGRRAVYAWRLGSAAVPNERPRGNVSVAVAPGGLEKALAVLKKKMAESGTFASLKRHAHYVKPSERRRMKSARARSKLRRQLARQEERKREAA